MSRLSSWPNRWIGFNCAAIFGQTLIKSFESRATLIHGIRIVTLAPSTTNSYVGVSARSACLQPRYNFDGMDNEVTN
jgi:hypothetical protein